MPHLTGPLDSRVLKKIETARPTGTATKVSLLQQRVCLVKVCPPMIYHVGLLACESGSERRLIFEHGPVAYDAARDLSDTVFIPLPPVDNTLEDIAAFERTLPKKYVLGARDCRHHVLDLLDYLYGVT